MHKTCSTCSQCVKRAASLVRHEWSGCNRTERGTRVVDGCCCCCCLAGWLTRRVRFCGTSVHKRKHQVVNLLLLRTCAAARSSKLASSKQGVQIAHYAALASFLCANARFKNNHTWHIKTKQSRHTKSQPRPKLHNQPKKPPALNTKSSPKPTH